MFKVEFTRERTRLAVKAGVILVVVLFLGAVWGGITVKVPFPTVRQLFYNRSVGEIYGTKEVGQTFFSDKDGLTTVGFHMATFGKRKNDKLVIFELRNVVSDKTILRAMTVNADSFADHEWYEFRFPPLGDSAGKKYYASLRSPDSAPGNAISIDYKNTDSYGGKDYSLIATRYDAEGKTDLKNAVKTGQDASFMVSHEISGWRYLGLTGKRVVKEFL